MRLLSFERDDGNAAYGVLREGDELVDLTSRIENAPTLKRLLGRPGWVELAREQAHAKADHRLADVRLLPPIPDPGVIACVGHNYEEHRIETQRDPTEHPSIFFRHAESLVGHDRPLLRPVESSQLDYEGELAIVIGRAGRRIRPEAAWEYVAGVSCFNDGSVRDWQHHTRQFGPGKNFASSGGFGPYLVTLDELPSDRIVQLETRVNGERVQRARTDQMIFSIPDVLAYLSTFLTLQPGDVIATGTPGGVGVKRQPPLWLKPGDFVDVEISGVGRLRNPVAQEA